MVDLINRMPTGAAGVGSAMPTSAVPTVKSKVPRPTTINPDALERQQKGKTPTPKPPVRPTRPITVPSLDPKNQPTAGQEALDEAAYNARGAVRAGGDPKIGGTAAAEWRKGLRYRAATKLGVNDLTTPEMNPYGRFRAGQTKADTWRETIMNMEALGTKWERNRATRAARWFANSVLQTFTTQIGVGGKLNVAEPLTGPAMEFFRGNRGAAIKGGLMNLGFQLLAYTAHSANMEDTLSGIEDMMRENNIPEEYVAGAARAYLDAIKGPSYAESMMTATANDAQIVAMSTALGAGIGAFGLGIGAFAGAGLGWGLGTIIAGANSLLPMLGAKDAPNLYNAIPHNFYESDDYGKFAESFGLKAVTDYLAKADPNRFVPAEESNQWITKYYSTNVPLADDPRNEEILGLIEQGYFVNQIDGKYGIDYGAWQEYMINTAVFKTDADKKRYLPEKTKAGTDFAANIQTNLGTQEQWSALWRNYTPLHYEP